MSEQKLTEWFPGNVKPTRRGVYQQRSGSLGSIGYQRWDGFRWCLWCEDADEAATMTTAVTHSCQNDPWRGLAQDPKVKK